MIQLIHLFAPKSTPVSAMQRIARRLMVSGCSIIALGVTGAMAGSALVQKEPATHFVAESPSLKAMAKTAIASKNDRVEAGIELTQAPPASRLVRMNVTAYCPCTKCCGKNAAGITASGKRVSADGGRFVAAPSNYPFGTQLLIDGYNAGKAVAVLDRGGAIKGNHLDVYFPTHEQALAWGRRMIDVTVLN